MCHSAIFGNANAQSVREHFVEVLERRGRSPVPFIPEPGSKVPGFFGGQRFDDGVDVLGRPRAPGQYRDVSAHDDVPYTEVVQYRRHVDDELVEQGELLVQMEDPIVEAHRTRIGRPHI